jgi:cytochrome oxidase Cu insertion factor (SCO1/SenC/PrrC family)
MSEIETMTTDNENGRTPQRRARLLIVGICLWTLVGVVGMATVWKFYQRSRTADVQIGNGTPSDDGNTSVKQSDDKQGKPPKEERSSGWGPQGLPDFELVNTRGKTISKKDLLGKPWVVCFIFTRCAGACSNVSLKMNQLAESMKNDEGVRFVTITVDPQFDTQDVLAGYAEIYRDDPDRWLFLTGDVDRIYQLIHYGFEQTVYEARGAERKPGFEVAHSLNIMHVDATGRVVGKYAANDTEMAKLKRALRAESRDSQQKTNKKSASDAAGDS